MNENGTLLNSLFLFFGVLLFVASVFNWKYFFGLRKAQILVKAIGLNATRIFYALLGLFFAVVGANQLFALDILSF